MGFVLPTKALEDLFRQICMKKNQIMKTFKRKLARGDRRRPRGQAAGRGGGEGGSTEARYITK